MRLQDKVTIITGAGHGIGRAYARCFAGEGAQVVVAEIDAPAGERVADEIRESGGLAWARTTDVRNFVDVQGMVSECVKRYGRIDVLLNNAAIYNHPAVWKGPVEDMPEEAWDRIIDVNLKGVFLCCK